MREESTELLGDFLLDVSDVPLDQLAGLADGVIVEALRDVLDPQGQRQFSGGFQACI